MDDMKEALDKAASSSDQAVRNMALRYREILKELDQYEAFFGIYKQGIRLNGSAAPAVRASVPRAVTPKASAGSRSDKADAFSAAMQTILTTAGRPLKLNEVHEAYQQAHPDDQTSIETFRQRLVKRREAITLLPRVGYWWAATPLPETATDA